jgi:hypothetical protein
MPFASVACAAGTVLTGAWLTAPTSTVIESVSDFGEPVPPAPKSVVPIWTVAMPWKAAVGENCRPLSAALTLASVPVKVIVASALPSPVLKLRPVSPLSVSVPLVAVRVTETLVSSVSAMLMALPLPELKTSGVSIAVTCRPGTVLTGASLRETSNPVWS